MAFPRTPTRPAVSSCLSPVHMSASASHSLHVERPRCSSSRNVAGCRGSLQRTQAVAEVTDSTFSSDILQAEVPVLVEFWATWCGPCKLIDPSLKTLDEESDGKLKIVKIEVDANPKVVEEYDVYGLPTFLLFKDGAMVQGSKHEGALALPAIKSWLESNGVAL